MKKWKTIYLWLVIVLFVLLWIPYFQNISWDASIMFFAGEFSFLSIYPWILFFGLLEWALIVFYLRSLVGDMGKKDVEKFDL